MCGIKDDNFHRILGQTLFRLETEFNEFLNGLKGEFEVPDLTDIELNAREEAIRFAEAKIEEMRQTLNELKDATEENEEMLMELQLKLGNLRRVALKHPYHPYLPIPNPNLPIPH